MRVLIAESAAETRRRLSLIVEGLGHEALTASDASEA